MINELEYPIYQFVVELSDNSWSSAHAAMYPKELLDAELDAELAEFVDAHLGLERGKALHIDGLPYHTLREAVDDGAIDILTFSWYYLRHDTWCLGWLGHYTFNTHLSDRECFLSLEAYVRKNRDNVKQEWESYVEYWERVPEEERRTFMGAEDRWRWKGPCRCDHCTAKGIVRIDH